MTKSLDNFIQNNSIDYYNIKNLITQDCTVYRIFPGDYNDTSIFRLSYNDPYLFFSYEEKIYSKLVIKIKPLNKFTIENLKKHLDIYSNVPNNNIHKIIGIQRINLLSYKYVLDTFPTKYVDDLSQIIYAKSDTGHILDDYLLIIGEDYENLFHVEENMQVKPRVNAIIKDDKIKTKLFLSFLFNMINYYQHNINTSEIDIFGIGIRTVSKPNTLSIQTKKGVYQIDSTIEIAQDKYLEPIITKCLNQKNHRDIINLDYFLPYGNYVLYKNFTKDFLYPYISSDIIKDTFGNMAAYIIESFGSVIRYTEDVNDHIDYIMNVYTILNKPTTKIDSDNITNTYILNLLQTDLLSKCQDNSYLCLRDKMDVIVHKNPNLLVEMNSPLEINPSNIGKIPMDDQVLFNKYNNTYGIKIFGDNKNLPKKEIFSRRICLTRYQYASLKTTYSISQKIIQNNYQFFDAFIGTQIKNLMSLICDNLYTVNGYFHQNKFISDFLELTSNFEIPILHKFEKPTFHFGVYANMVYQNINDIINEGTIINKVMLFHGLSQVIHYALIRKLFMVLLVDDLGLDPSILIKYGICNDDITLDTVSPNDHFDLKSYCKKHHINYRMVTYMYQTYKRDIPDFLSYLFDDIDRDMRLISKIYQPNLEQLGKIFMNGDLISFYDISSLLCIGYFSNDLLSNVNQIKTFSILMNSIPHHNMAIVHLLIQIFNEPFNTNLFTHDDSESHFHWLLQDNQLTINYKDNTYSFNGHAAYNKIRSYDNKNNKYYLSVTFHKMISRIVDLFYTNKTYKLHDLVSTIYNIVGDDLDNNDLYVIMSIMRVEDEKLWMSDSEYFYNIMYRQKSMLDYINNNYNITDILTNDDLIYNETLCACVERTQNFVKPIDTFGNTCILLQKMFKNNHSKN